MPWVRDKAKKNAAARIRYARDREQINARRREEHRINPRPKKPYKPAPLARRNTHLKYAYGVTLAEYLVLQEQQNGRCAICKSEGAKDRHGKLCLDHDHQTRRARGLLCITCNAGLGSFKDNPELLAAAILYLGKYHA